MLPERVGVDADAIKIMLVLLTPQDRRPRESGGPENSKKGWITASVGMTDDALFVAYRVSFDS